MTFKTSKSIAVAAEQARQIRLQRAQAAARIKAAQEARMGKPFVYQPTGYIPQVGAPGFNHF